MEQAAQFGVAYRCCSVFTPSGRPINRGAWSATALSFHPTSGQEWAAMPPPKGILPFADFIARLQNSPSLAGLTAARVRSTLALDEQQTHLLQLYAGITADHSFVDDAGQIFDCVPFEQQPALRNARAKGPAIVVPPRAPSVFIASPQRPAPHPPTLDAFGNSRGCPPGTVPFRRITLRELTRFETLEHYLKKTHRPAPRVGRSEGSGEPGIAANTQEPAHEYANAFQNADNRGGLGVLNVWSPIVNDQQVFSLSQHWYTADGPNGTQSVEFGWQVCPQMYGHSRPTLFSYWTADNYKTTGSYNNTSGEFVQTSTTHAVGMALEKSSTRDGEQFEIALCVFLDVDKWWLFLNGTDADHAIGYYPASYYGDGPLATHAKRIDFGGETVGSSTFPPMGSGDFASAGFRRSAYHRNVCYYDLSRVSQVANLTPSEDWPTSYTIAVGTSHDWGEYFYFGGPGS
jgi:hypothetical protein